MRYDDGNPFVDRYTALMALRAVQVLVFALALSLLAVVTYGS